MRSIAFFGMNAVPVLHQSATRVVECRVGVCHVSQSNQTFLHEDHVLAWDGCHGHPSVQHAVALDMAPRDHVGSELEALAVKCERSGTGFREPALDERAKFLIQWIQ